MKFSTISFAIFLSSKTITILSDIIYVSKRSKKFEKQRPYSATKMDF